MLERDPSAPVQVERPTSERVTTAFTRQMSGKTPGALKLALNTTVTKIRAGQSDATGRTAAREVTLPNDNVFSMIGREAAARFLSAQRHACERRLAASNLAELHPAFSSSVSSFIIGRAIIRSSFRCSVG